MARNPDSRRLHLDLPPNAWAALEALRTSLEATTQVEAIRIALKTMAKLVEESGRGGRILIERPDGERVEILLPIHN